MLCLPVIANQFVCHLSVMLVHPIQKIEIFSNIVAPSNSTRTCAVCIKIVEKIQSGSVQDWTVVNARLMVKISQFVPLSLPRLLPRPAAKFMD